MTLRPAILLAAATGLLSPFAAPATAQVLCENGTAAGYPCSSIDLASMLTPPELGAGTGHYINDLWGWTDETSGREFALVGRTDGTAFVEVTDPTNPVYLGNLPTNTVATIWRDVKVYSNHAYIVADGASNHGVQVFDLTQLLAITTPDSLSAVTVYSGIASAHNIAINEDTGFAYSVGNRSGGTTCGGGLHMIDLSNPASPQFAGCFADTNTGRSGTGYTHDAQCVIYHGPDATYQGREICIGSNETSISVADVTDKGSPEAITFASYPTASYVHQGWLSDDHRYFYQNDELDEFADSTNTATIIWDLEDLDDPQVANIHVHSTTNVDHNLYVRGTMLYQAHYHNGLRISDITNPTDIVEVGFFDTRPDLDGRGYGGAWSVYPFLDSGTVLVSSNNGLFVLTPRGPASVGVEDELAEVVSRSSVTVAPNPMGGSGVVTVQVDQADRVRVSVYDVLGREVRVLVDREFPSNAAVEIPLSREGLPAGTYFAVARGSGISASSKFVIAE